MARQAGQSKHEQSKERSPDRGLQSHNKHDRLNVDYAQLKSFKYIMGPKTEATMKKGRVSMSS